MAESDTPVAIPEISEEERTSAGDDLEASVIVYNCDCHTYQQVISLFCEAIPGMLPQRAFELAWQIDHQGSATVYSGTWERAEGIAKRLAGGGLRVVIR
ncbi:MAG: ATP-dependent Clp protease adaptor ClpS [Nitrospirales bacterium]